MNLIKLFSYLSNKRKIQIYLLFVFMIFNASSEVLTISLIYPFLDYLTKGSNLENINFFTQFLNNQNLIFLLPFLFILSIILISLARVIWVYLKYKVSAFIGIELNQYIYNNNINMPYQEVLITDSSDLIAISSIHIETTTVAINNFLEFIISSVTLIGITFSLLILDFKLTITSFFIFTSFYLCLTLVIKDKLLINSQIIVEKNKSQIQLVQETFNSFRTIILHDSRDFFRKIFINQEYDKRMKNAENRFLQEVPRSIVEGIGISALVLYTVLNLSNNTIEVIPLLGTFAFALQRLLPAFQRVFSNFAGIRSRERDVDKVLKFLINDKSIRSDKGKAKNINFIGTIEFKNVSFKYNVNDPYIFRNINFEINSGDKVAIVGRSGAGKSTLLDLLLGLIDPIEGEILINDKKLNSNKNKYLKKSWQKITSLVPQKICLMDTSISKNIAFTFDENKINYKKINSVIEMVNLSDFVRKPKIGINYLVGEMGNLLSGGQIQRIAIARAIYKDFQVLILDEAYSALDNLTSKKIKNNLIRKYPEKTFIEISHKFESLDQFNKVIQINNGKVELIKNS